MENNIFEEFQQKKRKVGELASQAVSFGWLKKEEGDDILKKLEDDKLTIGVIGQMKCGKSTFLNAFVFEDDVLPSATTPMTAALSVITYGEEKKIEAEFYTADEWAEQKATASRNLAEAEGNELLKSKIQSAKELVEKSRLLPGAVESFLGQKKEDSFENLIEYVGADGKFISITKAVKIFYPKEYLKGVEIVDTPGFNDPIVSREERTKEFLKRADVVLLMLYAGRPFDATDRQILFKNVGQCGTGRVLVGINKYDIPYETGETEEEIEKYVVSQLESAAAECGNSDIKDILKLTHPIPLSANMALLAELPMSKVTANEAYNFAYKRYLDIFEADGQKQLMEKSHLANLVGAVRDVIENEKAQILIRKPIAQIKAAGASRLADIEDQISKQSLIVSDCSKPDDELEEKMSALGKAKKRIDKKLESLGDDVSASIDDVKRRGQNEIEDIWERAQDQNRQIHANGSGWREFWTGDALSKNDKANLEQLDSHLGLDIKRSMESTMDKCKDLVIKAVNDFLDDCGDVLYKYLSDFDSKGLTKKVRNQVQFVCEVDKSFGLDKEFNPEDVFASVIPMRDKAIESVKTIIVKNGVDELTAQLQKIIDDKAGREKKQKEAQKQLDDLAASKSTLEEQISQVEALAQ
ncbi:MAG: dynamin family protein [Bacteroidales bacterium]|nr:dynamin family protein [Bacteroidales bacterium]